MEQASDLPPPNSSPGDARAALRAMIDNPWQLLAILFGAMGVLGLPVLWYSRAFGTLAKIVIGILVTLWTAALVGLCWWSLSFTAERLRDLRW